MGLAVDATIYYHNCHLLKLKSFIKTIEKGSSWENWIQEVDLEDQFMEKSCERTRDVIIGNLVRFAAVIIDVFNSWR